MKPLTLLGIVITGVIVVIMIASTLGSIKDNTERNAIDLVISYPKTKQLLSDNDGEWNQVVHYCYFGDAPSFLNTVEWMQRDSTLHVHRNELEWLISRIGENFDHFLVYGFDGVAICHRDVPVVIIAKCDTKSDGEAWADQRGRVILIDVDRARQARLKMSFYGYTP
jgi:hypothetical protein